MHCSPLENLKKQPFSANEAILKNVYFAILETDRPKSCENIKYDILFRNNIHNTM